MSREPKLNDAMRQELEGWLAGTFSGDVVPPEPLELDEQAQQEAFDRLNKANDAAHRRKSRRPRRFVVRPEDAGD